MNPSTVNPELELDTAILGHLLPPSWKADIPRWFAEDTPSFDWAGYVVGEEEQEAILWGKSGVSGCGCGPDGCGHVYLWREW